MKKFVALFLLIILVALPLQTFAANKFSDVKTYINEINFLVNEEIINGYPDGTFRPTEFVTKKQIAVMMSRTLKLDLNNVTDPGFKDVSKSNSAYREIAAVVNAGIMPKGTNFNPGSPGTREMMARAIVIGLNLQGDTSIKFNDVYLNNPNKSYISILADNNITTGYEDGTFKPFSSLTRAHFSAFLARALNDSFKPINDKTLTTQEIVKMHDSRIFLLEINNVTLGSGILIGNGLILTNQHVINDFQFGTAFSIDDKKYEIAGIVESDELKDLALIKLKENITASKVTFKRYEDLKKGEKVVAIGNPLGLQNTVSEGIISSFRDIEGISTIQHTAQMTFGSSGGGLFDTKGNLIGVTTSVEENETADLNFSVSINELDSWKSFLKLSHSQLKVQPIFPPKPVLEVIYRNVAFGMSPKEVIEAEGSIPSDSTSDSIYYYGVSDHSIEADVYYTFKDNKLYSISTYYLGFETLSHSDKEEFFFDMLDVLEYEYGEADYYDFDWNNDIKDYSIATYWNYPLMSWNAIIPDSDLENPYAVLVIENDME
ncbi:trypsin-like peptidase domain-containing protein [Paenisporosarcina quisquiliarum]|uniref:trypsin-like peptidase domain-containing protein n=1 Tax=Paenisporosarcina quisquiliarum TaxID=365346 RepID=UPI003735FCEC